MEDTEKGKDRFRSVVLFLSVSSVLSVVHNFDFRRPTGISVGHARRVAVVSRLLKLVVGDLQRAIRAVDHGIGQALCLR
jgi:hypothetical protein